VVQSLLNAKGIEAGGFRYADALVAIYPFLHKLVLPAGVMDLSTVRPPADVVLLAPKASLAVRADLHPALQYLLLDAAVQISFAAWNFPESRAISGCRINRSSTERRSTSILQDRPPFFTRIPSVLGRYIVRKDACRASSNDRATRCSN